MSDPKNSPAGYDLHLHTYWSYDATAEPESYFRRAAELGVTCLAITEHHNMDSWEEIEPMARRYPEIRWIRAAELTADTSMGAVDLLCYNLPATPAGALAECLDTYRAWQQAAGAARSRWMQALGYGYGDAERLEALRSFRPEQVLERQGATHLPIPKEAEYFLRRNWIASREEFRSLLRTKTEEFEYPRYPSVAQVVPAVKQAGGVVVMAHPTLYVLPDDLHRMDALREECALDGIECAHRRVGPSLTPLYRDYCRKHGLVSTAGSDSHDPTDLSAPTREWGHTPERRFASHLGEPRWLEEFLERFPGR